MIISIHDVLRLLTIACGDDNGFRLRRLGPIQQLAFWKRVFNFRSIILGALEIPDVVLLFVICQLRCLVCGKLVAAFPRICVLCIF